MKKTRNLKTTISLALCLLGLGLFAQTTVGPFTFYPTNIGGTMQGQAQISGVPAVAGDIIAAFDPADDCVGAAELTIFGGLAYINFVIYGDDGDGHGMSVGEDFYIRLYDASAEQIIEYGLPLSGWQNTNFTPMPGYDNPSQIYNFVGCEDAFAYAGIEATFCDNQVSIDLVDAYVENAVSVLWTTQGDGFFNSETLVNPQYYPGPDDLISGEVALCIQAYATPPCADDEDCVFITFQPSPTVSVGWDATICQGQEFFLADAFASDYADLYWTSSCDGSFDDPFALNPVFTPAAGDYGATCTLCLEALPISPCEIFATACMDLTVLENPQADAGNDATITEGGTCQLFGTASNYASLQWTTQGDGTFNPENTLNTIYTPGDQDILDGDVTLCLQAAPLNPCTISDQDCMSLTILGSGSPFVPVWTTPFQAMSVFVTQALANDINLMAGDEIGVFDIDPVSGEEICVGAGVLTEELTGGAFIEIIVSMDDGLGDANGFQPGNEMIFKMYSNNPVIGFVPDVNVIFPYAGYDEVFTPLGTTVVELEGFTTQNIEMIQGWNIISARVIPQAPDMLDVFNPLIQDDVLIKVLDQDGNSVVHLPFPPPSGQWNNSIGNWQSEQGYYVKVGENTSLTMQGLSVLYPFEISLRQGWSIISMPCTENQSAQALLQGLIDSGKLLKVINDAGESIVYLPFPPPNGQWNFGFDNFEPGEGYYVKVNEATSLTFDCEVKDFIQIYSNIKTAKPDYFAPCFQNNPYMSMTAALSVTNLEPGDEVAVFDGEICVGAGKVGDNAFISFPLSADDPDTELQDGFIAGNQLSFSVWHQSTNQVFENVQVDFFQGDKLFTPLGTFTGEVNEILTGIGNNNSGDKSWVTISPNPSRDMSVISYYIPQSGKVSMNLIEMNGRHVAELLNQNMQRGANSLQFNTRAYQKGSYLLIFKYEGEQPENTAVKVLIY